MTHEEIPRVIEGNMKELFNKLYHVRCLEKLREVKKLHKKIVTQTLKVELNTEAAL